MNKYQGYRKLWFLVLLLAAFVGGCASNADEIPQIPDTTAPTVSFTSPTDTAVAVPINRKLNVAFSEAMSPASISTASFTLKETIGNTPVNGNVTPIATSATFAPSIPLKFSTNYTATIKGGIGGVKDLAGNPMATDFVFTFTTGLVADTIAPTVSVTSPTDTAVAVPTNRKVTVGFSEEMDPATISDALASFTLKETVSNVPINGTVTRAGTSAIFTPTNLLKTNTKYTATIKGGTGGVKDLASIPMVNDFVFTFTTGPTADVTAPTLISTFAADGATGLPVNSVTTATFSEPMNPATLASPATNFTVKETLNSAPVNGVVTYSGNTATFTPSIGALKPLTQYTSTITSGTTGAKDLSGNALISGLTVNPWKWTTGPAADITAPRVTVTNPANNATNVPVDKKINATFNKAMSLDTMTTANFKLNETGVVGDIIGTVAYDVQNNIATFSPQNNLKPDTNYTVTVTNGAKDFAGNALVVPAVDGLNPWAFQTAAAIIPPVNLAINLRGATSFGIAAGAGMSSTGITVVNGDVSLTPTATCADATGLPANCAVNNKPASSTGLTVNGTIYFAADPFDNGVTANTVKNDLNSAWIEGKAKVPNKPTIAGDQLSSVLPYSPGIYHNANLGLAASGVATLDGGGDANAVFIFQVDLDFTDSGTTLLPSEIRLINGAQARNVWFVVGRDAVIGNGTIWNGNVLAGRDLTINIGAKMLGRALSGAAAGGAGAIALKDGATITVPQ